VAWTDHDHRCADGAKDAEEHGTDPSRGSHRGGVRQKTLLPLDDVLGYLKDTISSLSRSALPRCLQRHGISRRPIEEIAEKRERFKAYEIGYVHIDSCELRHAAGKLIMFVAIDRVSKFTYVEFHDKAGKMAGAAFLKTLVEVFPIKSTPC
jgi:hypothetical protein